MRYSKNKLEIGNYFQHFFQKTILIKWVVTRLESEYSYALLQKDHSF